MQTKNQFTAVAFLAMSLSGLAAAQSCALPPGTVGIGTYCKQEVVIASTVKAGAPDAAGKSKALQLAQIDPTSAASLASTQPAAGASASVATAQAGTALAAAPAPGTAQSENIKTWTILPTDGRLATSFERWAKSEGMRLIWDAKRHVMLSSADSFTGTLSEALQRVLSSPAIRQSDYPLEACIYPNNPPVLRITRMSEQAQECPQ